jgi:hypothetical protein
MELPPFLTARYSGNQKIIELLKIEFVGHKKETIIRDPNFRET